MLNVNSFTFRQASKLPTCKVVISKTDPEKCQTFNMFIYVHVNHVYNLIFANELSRDIIIDKYLKTIYSTELVQCNVHYQHSLA